jgi:glucoamylase
MTPLAAWIGTQYRRSAEAMLSAISPVTLEKTRFGRRIRAVPGSVVASPVLAAYDPDPDYFFHWYRDSAVIIDALRLLHEDAVAGPQALTFLGDFVRFSASLSSLDGRALLQDAKWRQAIDPSLAQYVREDAELEQVRGERVRGETRVNPDGTLDVSRWGRPQHDGPALRALMLLRWSHAVAADSALSGSLAGLLVADLTYVSGHGGEACFDIWEEELGHHYYTQCVSAAALLAGADWLVARGAALVPGEEPPQLAGRWRAAGEELLKALDDYWLEEEGYYRSRVLPGGHRSPKELDVSVLLAVLHAGRLQGRHTAADPRIHATLERLAELFAADYPINIGRPSGRAPALGRYPGDVYYSGGAYYFATLAGAELCYRAARALAAPELTALGDAYLETVRAFTPESGELSEQFDRGSGMQTSARQLAWSHAAFISCVHARRASPGLA